MKRVIIVTVFVPVVWYALVLFVLPCLPHCARPALISAALANLRGHLMEVATGTRAFGDATPGGMLDHLTKERRYGNEYRISLVHDDTGATKAVVAYPRVVRSYKFGWFHAAAFLCSERSTFPTLALLPDGRVLEDRATGYCDDQIPGESCLAAMVEVTSWPEIVGAAAAARRP